MKNFQKTHLEDLPRVELHDRLGLTGCEATVNELPPGGFVPFVHAHKENEELYGILEGRGELWIDGEVVEIQAGDWFRIAPQGKRALRAAADSALRFVCIQTRAGSLEHWTMTDGVPCEEKAPWMP